MDLKECVLGVTNDLKRRKVRFGKVFLHGGVIDYDINAIEIIM